MKLHEALRVILKKSGSSVLDDRRFLSFLADYRVYEDYPAMKQVMKALAECGYAREFSCRIRNKNDRDISLYEAYLKRALSEAFGFKQEFASYAADSIAYALELTDSVNEPADHGYDAVEPNASHVGGSATQDAERSVSQGNSSVPDYLRKKANQGDAEAQKILGDMYFDGDLVSKDRVQAFYWYRKSAEQGNPDAQYCLGEMYDRDLGTVENNTDSDHFSSQFDKNRAEAEKWYLKAAEHGNPDAMKMLGFEYGSRVEIAWFHDKYDKTDKHTEYAQKSAMWYQKAAERLMMLSEQGHTNAMLSLGRMYRDGEGVKKDPSEAEKWFSKASSLGNEWAGVNLGDMYRSGDGVGRSGIAAVKSYMQAAGNGSVRAMIALGDMYKNGDGVACDYTNAMKWYKKAAGQNSSEALFNLGSMYRYGQGVRQDFDEAAKWYGRAALLGDYDSPYELGEMYREESWSRHDLNEAMKWYRKASDKDNGAAQYRIGTMYENGIGVERNQDEALKWYEKAAENCDENAEKRLYQLGLAAAQSGDAEAQYRLGEKYYCGQGVEEDFKLAVKWYRKAADQGNAEAQNELGEMYRYGFGVEEDYKEAVKWFRKAAEQANRDAMLSLSIMYSNGWGVEKDPAESDKWYKLYKQ